MKDQAMALLLAPYTDHPIIGWAVREYGPEQFGRIINALTTDGTWEMLSTGERTYLGAVLAIWNGNDIVTFAQVINQLDRGHLARLIAAICLTRSIPFPGAAPSPASN